jgi:aspartyl-tRNA(Asn)/glutamyl-tRNA(Gln) amidotransferase subunit B
MKAVRLVLDYEIRRQSALLKEGKPVQRETRLWDEVRERSGRMRSKEEAQDYRYFPEPDLLPFEVDNEMMSRASTGVPELPLERRRRFCSTLGLSKYDASVLTDERAVADYFESCLKVYNAPKSMANWIMNDVLRDVNERKMPITAFEVPPERLAELARLTDEGKVNTNAARSVLAKMVEDAKAARNVGVVGTGEGAIQEQEMGVPVVTIRPGELIEQMGLEQVSDEAALAPMVEQVIRDNPKAVQDYLAGKEQAVGPLVGEVMRLTRGKSDPRLVNKMLRARLDTKG